MIKLILLLAPAYLIFLSTNPSTTSNSSFVARDAAHHHEEHHGEHPGEHHREHRANDAARQYEGVRGGGVVNPVVVPTQTVVPTTTVLPTNQVNSNQINQNR